MKYRITKYNPKFRTLEGAYTLDEWTSISDIGISFNNKVFTKDNYLETENVYLNTIYFILKDHNSSGTVIKKLEKDYSLMNEIPKLAETDYSINIEKFINSVENNQILDIENTLTISKLILREVLWCELEDIEQNFTISFGYDYYLYCDSNSFSDTLINQITDQKLYID